MNFAHTTQPLSPATPPHSPRDTSGWLRRRNPLPASFSKPSTPPRRKHYDAYIRSLDNNSTTADFSWDTDTISVRSQSPNSSFSYDSHDDSLLAIQSKQKQHQRTINELNLKLEARDFEIARYIENIDQLEEQLKTARLRAAADNKRDEERDEYITWYEEQLYAKCTELEALENDHRLALQSSLQSAEVKHQRVVDGLMLRISEAEDRSRRLTVCSDDMYRELEQTKTDIKYQHERELQDARLALLREKRVSSDLQDKLNNYAVHIDELKLQVQTLTLALAFYRDRELDSNPADELTAVSGMSLSLHVEMAQAMQNTGHSDSNKNQVLAGASAVPLDSRFSLFNTSANVGHVLAGYAAEDACFQVGGIRPIPLEQKKHKSGNMLPASAPAPAPGGTIYWLAVYVHMVWSFYLRLWIMPLWRLACFSIGILVEIMACRPLGRLLLMIMLMPYNVSRRILHNKK
ncbi:hypothetical protein BX661DRAFT_185071 [Kickxella alabastrina]|uniref:uncharacterized protein n=1 Tax=Kickxella alabastrina TaxID=61397 RepID=UPI00221E3AB4|nr:uncharacterized protein BX661DRAFT_185071 [Kickxella alabastrina]KAI7824992.1 hypothetical protein BX661DRAFT_185071 [Kickxella alabastrina]